MEIGWAAAIRLKGKHLTGKWSDRKNLPSLAGISESIDLDRSMRNGYRLSKYSYL